MGALTGKVAIVTGASRGIGKGCALELGALGATVYVTGRSEKAGAHPLGGTVAETAAAVTSAGGRGVAVACDHRDDAQVRPLGASPLEPPAIGRLPSALARAGSVARA
jgi:NAD(P)-dependent dehydrogenase (short-subunit alcohol dehydrogenase family)